MSVLDSFYKTIMNFFIDEKFNKEMNKLETCMLDEDEVDCLTFDLEDKGFTYNEEKEWWERTWFVKTKTGEETSKEVYKKDGDQWKSMMFGNYGELFYEQTVGTRTDGHTTI